MNLDKIAIRGRSDSIFVRPLSSHQLQSNGCNSYMRSKLMVRTQK
jgi:hypothetical protein